jgi:hypothetical protein
LSFVVRETGCEEMLVHLHGEESGDALMQLAGEGRQTNDANIREYF